MRLLAINFGGLGDEVLFLPTLSAIKTEHPDWNITLLTEPRAKAIGQMSKAIDQVITFDIKKTPLKLADYLNLLGILRNGKFDTVVSSGSSSKVCLLLFASGIANRIGFLSGSLSKLLLNHAVPLQKNQYAALMYHDLVRGLNIAALPKLPKVDVNPDSLNAMRKFLQADSDNSKFDARRKVVIIHPGMSKLALDKGIIKTWSAENWREIIEYLLSLDCQVVLCGGPDDEETISQITAKLMHTQTTSGQFKNAFGKTSSIQDLVSLMHLSDLVACVDSAPMHIAVGLGQNLVALFGPTNPKRLLPDDQRFLFIRDPNAVPDTDVFMDGNKARGNENVHNSVQISVAEVKKLIDLQLQKCASPKISSISPA